MRIWVLFFALHIAQATPVKKPRMALHVTPLSAEEFLTFKIANYQKCMSGKMGIFAPSKPLQRQQHAGTCYSHAGAALVERFNFAIGRECMALWYRLQKLEWPENPSQLVEKINAEDSFLSGDSIQDFTEWLLKQSRFVTREGCDIKLLKKLDRDLKSTVQKNPVDLKGIQKKIDAVTRSFQWKKKEKAFEKFQPVELRNHLFGEARKVKELFGCTQRAQALKQYLCAGIPVSMRFKIGKGYRTFNHQHTGIAQEDSDWHAVNVYAAGPSFTAKGKNAFKIHETNLPKELQASPIYEGELLEKDVCRVSTFSVLLSEDDKKFLDAVEKKTGKLIEASRTLPLYWETQKMPFMPEALGFKNHIVKN